MNLTLGNLAKCFSEALESEEKYIGIMEKNPQHDLEELIIVRRNNFISKLNYYLQAYNRDLGHKITEGVKIMGFAKGNSLEEIEKRLLG